MDKVSTKGRLIRNIKYCAAGLLAGAVAGTCGSVFARLAAWAAAFRNAHGYCIYFLPLAGLAITAAYALCKYKDEGTDIVLRASRGEKDIPAAVAPLIICCSALTQLVGGSAGREGAALQLGAGSSSFAARLLGVDSSEAKQLFAVCGMSAGFSSVFGTPVAAAVFALEISVVGEIKRRFFAPSVISSMCAYIISKLLGVAEESYVIDARSDLSLANAAKIAVLAVFCGLLARLFCFVMESTGKFASEKLPNPYIRVLIASALLIAVYSIEGSPDFEGTGASLIEAALEGNSKSYAFILKIIVTAISLKFGFKGGEIVPAFSVGASFGCIAAPFLGLEPSMCAAVCMISMFADVTNCPLAALMISFEMFGFNCDVFFLTACAISWLVSGKCSLYKAQKFIFD